MCGIAGFFGSFEPALLERMNASIAHRGPDDAGTLWLEGPGIGLAHRRLSIIDLSPTGHQPMWDTDERVSIVFNGEIYNFHELRQELNARGYQFKGRSDTEVLLNLYRAEGDAMLGRLNGIFAFAIWDRETQTLLLARDGVGVKPLYYTETRLGFLFASEIKALLQEPSVSRTLDPLAVQSHLTYLWCPAPRTLLREVKKLEPGHAMRIRARRIEKRWQYYDLPYGQVIEPISVDTAVEQVRSSLRCAVARQMVADVPVGAFLSGGLDSSAVVAMAREHVTDERLACFTIGFKGDVARQEGMIEDLPYAQEVARHLDVDLHTIHVGPEMIDQLTEMVTHLDEPQADPAPLNVLFISRLARQHGIKVLLSGAGGDDLFTGYHRHFALLHERYLDWLPAAMRKRLSRMARHFPSRNPVARRIGRLLRYSDLSDDERIASYFFWISSDELARLYAPGLRASLLGESPAAPLLETLKQLPVDTPRLNRMLYLEGKHFLTDHNLNYTDKMSMAAGVEVRVPLLDPDLVGLAARLPVEFKQRGRTGKWIFKKAMEGILPHDVIYRPKTGFGAPLRYWLRHELRGVVEDVLSESSLQSRGLFDPAAVRDLVQADRAGRVDAAYPIFALICVELWCRSFIDRTVSVAIARHGATA
jgi:asparagine synthase (glutamine-hydrolysing)